MVGNGNKIMLLGCGFNIKNKLLWKKREKKLQNQNSFVVDTVKTCSCFLFDSEKWLFDKLADLTDITVTKLWNTVNIFLNAALTESLILRGKDTHLY